MTVGSVHPLRYQAGRHGEAAKLLMQLGKQSGESKLHPLRTKKLYVLAALEGELHRKTLFDSKKGGAGAANAADMLQSLLEQDRSGRVSHIESAACETEGPQID